MLFYYLCFMWLLCYYNTLHITIGADYIQDDLDLSSSVETMVPDKSGKGLTRAQKKNLKKKQKKKLLQNDRLFEVEEIISGFSELGVKDGNPDGSKSLLTHSEEIKSKDKATKEMEKTDHELHEPEEVPQKKIRALRKKIKQIEELETKLDHGEILEKEQLEKISKKDRFMEELSQLID